MYNYVMLIGKVKKIYGVWVINKEVIHLVVRCVRPFKNADGEYEYDDIDVVICDVLADFVKENLKGGDYVTVKGRLHSSNYQTLCYVVGERILTAKEEQQI